MTLARVINFLERLTPKKQKPASKGGPCITRSPISVMRPRAPLCWRSAAVKPTGFGISQ